jgi:hypothetical protein
VTSKEKLHLLVEKLADPEADVLLHELEAKQPTSAAPHASPTFIGIFDSGRSDLSTRYKEIRAAEFER